MSVRGSGPDDEFVLNECVKHLSRAGDPPPVGDEDAASAFRSRVAEAWRFPVIGLPRGVPPATPASAESSGATSEPGNLVTFVYKDRPGDRTEVAVLGTFATLFDPLPLREVLFDGEDTGYRALSVAVPAGQVHTYKFRVGRQFVLDPVNPQRERTGDGRLWSRFFTEGYLQPLILELWELRLLYRLVEQILPFRTAEAENFLRRYYFGLDKAARNSAVPAAFRLDESVGEVNAIDKLLAREEAHRLADYRICLKQIDRVLRLRNSATDPYEMPASDYVDLYTDMAAGGPIAGWDYAAYGNPAFFIALLRRHAVTTAFSHPKYAGNVGAAGWAYLAERYVDPVTRATLFDWPAALERPLGTSDYYR